MWNKNSGFTFIEVVVAVFVTGLVVVGVFGLIQSAIIDRTFALCQLQAAYLAQEGIELVRNQRDANWLDGSLDWDGNKANLMGATWADPHEAGVYPEFLRFTRTIIIDNTLGDHIEVSAVVSWPERRGSGLIEVVTNLYNWYGS
jgi:type II secretory pathway pseudopilin PulG